MKFDKETIIAIVICTIMLFGWSPIMDSLYPPPTPEELEKAAAEKAKIEQKAIQEDSQKPETKTTPKADQPKQEKPETKVEAPETAKASKAAAVEKPKAVVKSANVKTLQPAYLENDVIKVTIDPNAGKISSVLLKKYFTTEKVTFKKTDENIELLKNVKSGALGVSDDAVWIMTDIKLDSEKDGTPEKTIKLVRTFKTDEGANFSVTQIWQIKANYTLNYNLEIANLAKNSLALDNLKLSAGGLPNIHELANDKVPFREDHEITYCDPATNKVHSEVAEPSAGIFSKMFGGGDTDAPKAGFEKIEGSHASWIGVTNKYFTCILVPEKPFEDGIVLRSTLHPKDKPEKNVKEFMVGETDALINIKELPANTELKLPFEYYIGPKKIPLLKELDPNASKIMKLYIMGAFFLEPISSLMLNALLWLYGICGSYGLSIVLLTLIVKTLLWPVTHKANVSMRKMQRINPLIQEVRKTHKDNPQKVNAEMMKLYKEHGVNPLGGCLPILLQMPIFFALYAALSGAVEPRHTAFLWINDLTLPDTVATIFGVPINPLMLTMTATMVLQQKLTPSAADPAQQKMMMFMPLIMLVMLYSLPSGLTLYWTVSQLISIAQLVVNKKLEQRAELAIEAKK